MSRTLLRTLPFLLTAAFALASGPTFAAPPDFARVLACLAEVTQLL